MENEKIYELLIFYLVFLFSTTVHEAAHAWVAMLGGDLTAYRGGQVSLDPRPHIRREPFGMVLLPILGLFTAGWPIGFASTPYDPFWARNHPRRSALMALAGPLSNLTIALVAGIALRVGAMSGVFYAPPSIRFGRLAMASESGSTWEAAGFMLGVFFSMNLLLFVFNLIPLPPMDGSSVVPLLLTERATASYQDFIFGNPMLGLIGMIVAWQLIEPVFGPIFIRAVNLLYPGITYS